MQDLLTSFGCGWPLLAQGVISSLAAATLSAPAEVIRSRSMTVGSSFKDCTLSAALETLNPVPFEFRG